MKIPLNFERNWSIAYGFPFVFLQKGTGSSGMYLLPPQAKPKYEACQIITPVHLSAPSSLSKSYKWPPGYLPRRSNERRGNY